MSTTAAETTATGLVPGAHRTIRVLAPGDGPFRGTLVASGDGVAVMTDADELSGWAGWSYAGSEHVAGPLDLVRRSDGHGVLLPWCTETVDAFLGRREAIGAPLTAGEASTLVVSLLRGVGEVAGGDAGRWWLTDGGRPVFVIGDGEDVRDTAASLVDRLRRAGGDRALGRLLASVHDGLAEGRDRPRMPPVQLERWEAELFEIAAPRALDTALHAPERVRGIELLRAGAEPPAPATRRAARRSLREGTSRSDRRGAAGQRGPAAIAAGREWLREMGIAVAARIRLRSVPRREGAARTPAPSRRKLLLAGAAAVAVVAGGMLWPGGATGESPPEPTAAGTQRPSVGSSADATAEGTTDPSEAPEPMESPVEPEKPEDAAARLLDVISACADQGDTACGDAVADGSDGVVGALTGMLAAGTPSAALVDVYGDVAVIRLTSGGDDTSAEVGEMMLVLVRLNDDWLVRDVYGVADQPG